MKHLDLFSGIGGFALAARWVGWETVGFCEIEPYCRKVLAKHWPGVPIYSDIHGLYVYYGHSIEEVSIVTAGFPCQPYSVAGKQRGSRDDRALWPEVVRVLDRSKPAWFVGENVAGFAEMELKQATLDLAQLGYGVRVFDIPACGVGAPHTRRRLWIVAHAEWNQQPRQEPRSRKAGRVGRKQQPVAWDGHWKSALAKFRDVDDGLPGGVVRHRTDAARNAIVPQVAQIIFEAINAVEDNHGLKTNN